MTQDQGVNKEVQIENDEVVLKQMMEESKCDQPRLKFEYK